MDQQMSARITSQADDADFAASIILTIATKSCTATDAI